MARVEVATHVEATPEQVWGLLVDWESQPAWMADARSVAVVGDRRRGEGTRIVCRTDILFGLRLNDVLVVTGWHPPSQLAISHEGPVITGTGAFELSPTEHGTHLEWWEEFNVGLGDLGEAVATALVVPWVRRVFRRSVAELKRLSEAGASRA